MTNGLSLALSGNRHRGLRGGLLYRQAGLGGSQPGQFIAAVGVRGAAHIERGVLGLQGGASSRCGPQSTLRLQEQGDDGRANPAVAVSV